MTKILIAEDNAVNRELLCEILTGEYQVVEAADGQEAVAKVEETRPDPCSHASRIPNSRWASAIWPVRRALST